MANEVAQSYENHVRKLPAAYVATGLILGGYVVFATAVAVRWPRILHFTQVALSIGLLGLAWFVRANSLIVQNRIIRLEERLRLAALLPADLKPRIDELTVRQLVALRFASDGEVAELTRQVLDENLTDPDTIKRRVKSWRADHLRV